MSAEPDEQPPPSHADSEQVPSRRDAFEALPTHYRSRLAGFVLLLVALLIVVAGAALLRGSTGEPAHVRTLTPLTLLAPLQR